VKFFSQILRSSKSGRAKLGAKLKKMESQGIRGYQRRHRDTISGSAILMTVDPGVGARAGFTPQEIEVDVSDMLQGETAAMPVVANDRPYTIRVRFPQGKHLTLERIRSTSSPAMHGKDATLESLATITTKSTNRSSSRNLTLCGSNRGARRISVGERCRDCKKVVSTSYRCAIDSRAVRASSRSSRRLRRACDWC